MLKNTQREMQNQYFADTEKDSGSDSMETYSANQYGQISTNAYFDVNNCVNKFLDTLNKDNFRYYDESTEQYIQNEEEMKKNMYNVLSQKYIEDNKITLNNIYNYVNVTNGQTYYVTLETVSIQDSEIKSFLTHGIVVDNRLDFLYELYAVVNMDFLNERFSIEPIKSQNNSVKEMKISELETEIVKNSNNQFTPANPLFSDVIKNYVDIYKRLSISSPERLYELLNKEYREARFGSLDNFKQYVKKNYSTIYYIELTKYKINRNDGYTQYICIDQNENYYIFNEKSIFDYDIYLDMFTIELPEFKKEYENLSDIEKVKTNLQNVITAINNDNFKYVYNKLDDTFKRNNFSTINVFEKNISENLFSYNNIESGNYEQTGDNYICSLIISNKEKNETKKMQIIMKLEEGTNFTMSFNLD